MDKLPFRLIEIIQLNGKCQLKRKSWGYAHVSMYSVQMKKVELGLRKVALGIFLKILRKGYLFDIQTQFSLAAISRFASKNWFAVKQ